MVSGRKRPWAPESSGYDELFDVVRNRRMVYRYDTEPVPEEDVARILDAARWAPSGHNTQPWEFVVVRNRDHLAALGETLKRQREWMTTVDESFPAHGRVYLDQVPVAILVLGDVRAKSYFPRVGTFGPGEDEVTDSIYYESIGCCMQTIHLAAKSLGLGTVHLTVRHRYQDEIRDLLEIPDTMVIHDIVPVGVPADDPPGQNVSRAPLERKVHYDTFDADRIPDDQEFMRDLTDTKKRVGLMHGTSDT